MKRPTVEHHNQVIGGFAIDLLELELESASRPAGGETHADPRGLWLHSQLRIAGTTATDDCQEEDQPEDGSESEHSGSSLVVPGPSFTGSLPAHDPATFVPGQRVTGVKQCWKAVTGI
jgi:hypothetical protein